MTNSLSAATLLGPDGPLAQHLHDYQHRPVQLELAKAVEECIDQRRTLVAEAGSGIGKTFAYLVPALLSGRRVVVSTATRQLQDQLSRRDLPRLLKALKLDYTVAQLKGRRNYLCPHRVQRHLDEGRQPARVQRQLQQVRKWARQSLTGELDELSLPAESSLLPLITATQDNCLGQRCPQFTRCPLRQARQRAGQAELVVVNHALLLADRGLARNGMGALLQSDDVVVVDEAHQIPQLAMTRFGHTLNSQTMIAVLRRLQWLQRRHAPDMRPLRAVPEQLERQLTVLQRRLHEHADTAGSLADTPLQRAMQQLLGGLRQLYPVVELAAPRAGELQRIAAELAHLMSRLEHCLIPDASDSSAWYEVQPEGISLHQIPISLAPRFMDFMQQSGATWLFTSATLAVAGDMTHFAQRLGLEDYRTLLAPSPYDYARNSLCYLPDGIPQPHEDAYNSAVVAAAEPVIRACEGRTFFLFTSHKALQAAAQRLAGRLEFPLLVQGTAPNAQLLERFRSLGNAVLLGAASFWEGVDVRGASLSCVIIDRLPFAAPDAPLQQARIHQLQQAGIDPFYAEQLPRAVLALRQGIGRLIRDSRDRGVLMIADPRLRTRDYGKFFLQSLPAMPVTSDMNEIQTFFSATSN